MGRVGAGRRRQSEACTLYRKWTDCHPDHAFRTGQELAGQMIQQATKASWNICRRVAVNG